MAPRPTTRQRWAVDRQQLLILLVAAVMLTSFGLLVLWPKQRELTALGHAVDHERDVVSQKVLASHEGMYVSARIPSLRMAQRVFSRRLPSEPAVAQFLQVVAECVEAEPGVTHEIGQAQIPVTGSTPAVPLRLCLAGPFDAVYRCLVGVEGIDRLSRFRRVRFARSEGAGCVQAEAEILLYYLPEEQPATNPGQSGNGGGTTPERARG
ncbi:MAG TPA: hypothetical protein VM431_01365 [Phycisphaerae bacterium]|nr:hypothetical protein [Phycisphaerae bacterium]